MDLIACGYYMTILEIAIKFKNRHSQFPYDLPLLEVKTSNIDMWTHSCYLICVMDGRMQLGKGTLGRGRRSVRH